MFGCGRILPAPISRREWLGRCACGFGGIALASLMQEAEYSSFLHGADDLQSARLKNPLAPRPPHFAAKATNVIFLYLDGGLSQVDSFDPKPQLQADNGKPFAMKMEPTQFNNRGLALGSPWKFQNHGASGIPVSELFPNIAHHVDKLAVIRSMVSEFPEHTNANYFLHTGTGLQGRPSMGAWFGYGLGSECQNLPGFVVLNGGLVPPGGLDNFNSGFLPASYQGSVFNASEQPIANINRHEKSDALQQNKLAFMKQLDQSLLSRIGHVDAVDSAIKNYELAYRMQVAVPELTDLSQETAETKRMYGLEEKSKGTATYGKQLLLARRLVERGVRFIEVTCPNVGHDRWDQHGNLKQGHEDNAMAVDKPIGALLTDLAQRGLLEKTLVVFSGEFGRTPFAQGANGRDHNQYGFSLWMAGGGVKGGTIHGATDEYGYKAIENKCEIHDLHATMMHLLGFDHTRLTFRFGGRDMRLTDVKGHIVKEIIA
jgi:Protein of unknown function (DUF1501)